MTSSLRTSQLLSEFLSFKDSAAARGAQGRKMMEEKLRLYLWWKSKLVERKEDGRAAFAMPNKNLIDQNGSGEISEALKRKDKEKQARAANRRRIRGGAPPASSRDNQPSASGSSIESSRGKDDPESIAEL